MNRSARSKMLKSLGTIMVALLPVMLALWFAHVRAVSETHNQLHSFAQLALDKTELVILQADLARDAAEQYHGKACTSAHQQRMLNIIRGRLYISEHNLCPGRSFLVLDRYDARQPLYYSSRRLSTKTRYRYLLLSRYPFFCRL